MRRILRAIIGLAAGYVIGAGLGAGSVALFSGNTHDKSMEIVMTAAFVTGPLGAIVGLIAALLQSRRAAAREQ